jgi:signal transduction histidine kinase
MTTIENTFAIAFNNAEIGVWEVDPRSKKINFCKKAKTMFGLSPDLPVTLSLIFDKIIGVQRFLLFDKIRCVCLNGGRLNEEIAIIPDTGEPERWLQVNGQLFTNVILETKQFVGTMTDITHIKQDEIRRNDLIATISHELKSPLTTIKLYIQLIEKITAIQTDDLLKRYLNCAVNEVDSIEKLVETFLDVSAMVSGQIKLNPEPFDINILIFELLTKFKTTAPNHKFIFHDNQGTCIVADYFKLRLALNNLLTNAVKYSPEHTSITIVLLKTGKTLCISIRDEGIGISEENQRQLFQRFFRVDQLQATKIKGHGMGLFITKSIIQQHAGKIKVNSAAGNGSEFVVELPLNVSTNQD